MTIAGPRAVLPLVLVAVLLSRDGIGAVKAAASPPVCVDVVQTGGNVDFYAFIFEANRRIVPVGIVDLWLVLDESSQEIWMISADNYTRATHIRYGVTPTGFDQRVPSSGPPPDLTPGASYRVAVAAVGYGTASFVYMQPARKLSCEAEAPLR